MGLFLILFCPRLYSHMNFTRGEFSGLFNYHLPPQRQFYVRGGAGETLGWEETGDFCKKSKKEAYPPPPPLLWVAL